MLVAPVLVALLGSQMAVIAVGLFLPLVGLAMGRRLISLDASAVVPEEQLRLLGAIPIFAPLATLTLERLARVMIPIEVPTGAVIIQQGDIGDRFYVLASGHVKVTMDGQHVDAHGPGGYFGEVALLRNIPRTATVIARTPVRLYALEREAFLEAVTGHPESAATAESITRARYEDKQAEIAGTPQDPASTSLGQG
jgi:signal-transduction protein with cAMP-binding, CBS, and nucleotidyltransferase domain